MESWPLAGSALSCIALPRRHPPPGRPEVYVAYPVLGMVSAAFKYGPARQALETAAAGILRVLRRPAQRRGGGVLASLPAVALTVAHQGPGAPAVPAVPEALGARNLPLTAARLHSILVEACRRLHEVSMPVWTLNVGRSAAHHSGFIRWLERWGVLVKALPAHRGALQLGEGQQAYRPAALTPQLARRMEAILSAGPTLGVMQLRPCGAQSFGWAPPPLWQHAAQQHTARGSVRLHEARGSTQHATAAACAHPRATALPLGAWHPRQAADLQRLGRMRGPAYGHPRGLVPPWAGRHVLRPLADAHLPAVPRWP